MNLFGECNDLLVTGQIVGRMMLNIGLVFCMAHLIFNTWMMFIRENDTIRFVKF